MKWEEKCVSNWGKECEWWSDMRQGSLLMVKTEWNQWKKKERSATEKNIKKAKGSAKLDEQVKKSGEKEKIK